MVKNIKIALTGNPNSGKTSLFNALTGLNQKVGNFPGVTVDKKTGKTAISTKLNAHITDLPGTYSLYPKGKDELVAYEMVLNPLVKDKPEMIIVVVDAANLKRNLLFCTQVIDLKIPVIIALTMGDLARKKGTEIDISGLERELGVPIVSINPRKNKGLNQLKEKIAEIHEASFHPQADFIVLPEETKEVLRQIQKISGVESIYGALHIACAYDKTEFLSPEIRQQIETVLTKNNFQKAKIQGEEVLLRYQKLSQILQRTVVEDTPLKKKLRTEKFDRILLHKVWGNLILLFVLFIMFQCIFWIASYPMDWIDNGFALLKTWLWTILPVAWWSDLIINGVVSGIGGIVIFVPQIAILFGFINILEDTGYMSRISFLTDRLMRSAGLNGRSVMPLISGMACAIPAIMAARTIENKKERLITILVTPLMACSARLPIYTILISLIIPETYYLGFINAQGLVMMAMYFLGFFMALVVSKVLSWVMRNEGGSFFLMELPTYRAPRWNNVLITMYEKSKIFVVDAGKVILVISIILWALASYGLPSRMNAVDQKYANLEMQQNGVLTEDQEEAQAMEHLENSFAGMLGKSIEPAIQPLGFDWKMGIALISSFAAREVFVGTMATLYSVGQSDENIAPLKEKMRLAKRPDGSPVYTVATGFSLMVFYAFAMQCMSTLAIVKRETKTWKWAVIQLIYMTILAYVASLIIYQIMK